ncbi:MAG: cob(I)yrinic acid a,c-diamide adenosyltransferase [Muribaculaceae bacterium]|nr:cob(I)yrinic acid a,c-diamide adenosyltransferase [Muribaculaceae bacterium]
MKSTLYTRTGDNGTTSLVDGERVKKNSVRIEAYGTIDELNSFIGLLIASNPLDDTDRQTLTAIQSTLFSVGAYLASADAEVAAKMLPYLDQPLADIEAEIDRIDALLPRHNKFILPQGTTASATAHVARTVARRAERRILDLADIAPIAPAVISYINRLSDYLFALARLCNTLNGNNEIFWEPAK